MRPALVGLIALTLGSTAAAPAAESDLHARVEHHYVDSDGVKIHYVTLGEGPPVLMIHGFPDFWYTWRHQMEGLAEHFQVIAMDQRAYNRSGQPEGVESYAMRSLIGDVVAVVRDLGHQKATIVGHDWGGAVAWQVALNVPAITERLIILNLPHPNGLTRELATNEEQQSNSGYARAFQSGSASDPDIFFGGPMTPQTLSGWVSDPAAREFYVEAFERSYFDGMLNYYKRNYPRPGSTSTSPPQPLPKVEMPVLMFHGLDDTALHSDGLNNTWDWLDQDLTLVTVPGVGHFVQQDAAELVTSTMKWWLLARNPPSGD